MLGNLIDFGCTFDWITPLAAEIQDRIGGNVINAPRTATRKPKPIPPALAQVASAMLGGMRRAQRLWDKSPKLRAWVARKRRERKARRVMARESRKRNRRQR